MMRNQIIKSIKVSGLLRRGTLQQSPVISSGSIGQSVHYPPISASSCQQAQGGEPCQLLHSKMEGSVSALLQVPGNTTLPTHVPAPLPPLARGQGVLGGCAALSLLLCTATAILWKGAIAGAGRESLPLLSPPFPFAPKLWCR